MPDHFALWIQFDNGSHTILPIALWVSGSMNCSLILNEETDKFKLEAEFNEFHTEDTSKLNDTYPDVRSIDDETDVAIKPHRAAYPVDDAPSCAAFFRSHKAKREMLKALIELVDKKTFLWLTDSEFTINKGMAPSVFQVCVKKFGSNQGMINTNIYYPGFDLAFSIADMTSIVRALCEHTSLLEAKEKVRIPPARSK
ncbi:hypothetical protein PSV08DRAFT_249595 [Bipolaris maydis]|uniref:uncharacterized protein n=1 Tax=Cochliobolus heterostrophus TaxID=5016 RepID=UPI0024D602A4|nr:hypothetical protein PSV08DRAFT_249595 [Bipolaris maydis]